MNASHRTRGFTLIEMLVAVLLIGVVAGSAALMSTNTSSTQSLEFDEQLGTLIRSMPAAADANRTTVSVSVADGKVRLSTGQSLRLPSHLSVSSTLQVTATGSTGYVWRVVPGVSCLRYGLQAYGSLERTSC